MLITTFAYTYLEKAMCIVSIKHKLGLNTITMNHQLFLLKFTYYFGILFQPPRRERLVCTELFFATTVLRFIFLCIFSHLYILNAY
jgi:hypothetical protein